MCFLYGVPFEFATKVSAGADAALDPGAVDVAYHRRPESPFPAAIFHYDSASATGLPTNRGTPVVAA
ncbi:hypothetical protein B0T26DRAFT_756844 [Lasiosphaeria miniovina]|uniref:Uncharacterized protein n=1 Tax=Lasiosphaeria miniovina TaxID=1954250 RepID=A0AA39ZTK8_9PEZI|nr:uncharacterized protein B0T26DRAFT_756844 [Lasiosphaeria miniovina]KAK0703284.1 hypothetical protein B0T26DRAFT_756844 [Lasiosphaeria miniovina]